MTFYIQPTWPSTFDELDFWHGLAVTIEHDVVRLWLVNMDIFWEGPRRDRNHMVNIEWVFWEAKCLLFEYETGQGLSQRSYSSSSCSHNIASSPDVLSATPDIVSSREFAAHYNSGDMIRYSYDPPHAHKNRRLARICRLVCRDWAKRIPLGDPKLRIANDAVWHCMEDLWLLLPKRQWVWEFRAIEWWMERRHQDNLDRIWRAACKAWYPKLVQPINGFVSSEGQETSTLSSLAVTSKQYRIHLEPFVGPRFLENVRDINGRELYRMCRLVCRDWARQFPATDPGRYKWWLREGVMWYWVEGDWHVLPRGYWAWAFEDVEWWAERFCPELSSCRKLGCRCKGWYPKLLQPIDDTIRENFEYSTPTQQPPKCKPPTLATASSLPPELFEYICSGANRQSWSWRLVCRYWNKQCTPRVFERIDIDGSPECIRALWKVREHPMFGRHVKILHGIPSCDENSKVPWIHLLTQICTSTQAVWRNGVRDAHIQLEYISKRIRSIHYSLPRSVPRSFSRGIRSLKLTSVKVRQMEDLTHLACELPDLEKLVCRWLTFDLPPTELPRRRPRKSRNKLKEVHIVAGAKPTPPLAIPMLSLFLGAYDVASFLSDEEAAVILATLSLVHPYFKNGLVCIYDEQTRQLELRLLDLDTNSWACFRFKVSPAHSTTTLQVGIDADLLHGDSDYVLDRWKKLDIMLGRLRSASLEVCAQVVFEFDWREDIVHFAENVLGQLPSISEHFEVQYSEKRSWHWYQASLDSGEFRGDPKEELFDVYP